ncbi:unnamed protein product [Arctogadus glacialis]
MAQPLPANFPVAQFDQHAEGGKSSFRREDYSNPSPLSTGQGVTSAPPAVPPGGGVAVRDEWRELSDSCCQGNSCLMQGSLTARCPLPGSRVDGGRMSFCQVLSSNDSGCGYTTAQTQLCDLQNCEGFRLKLSLRFAETGNVHRDGVMVSIWNQARWALAQKTKSVRPAETSARGGGVALQDWLKTGGGQDLVTMEITGGPVGHLCGGQRECNREACHFR